MTISKKQSNPGLSDPVLARQTEASLAQAAVIARGKPTVTSAGELILPSTTVSTTSNSFTTTTSANNQTADTVTINRTSGTVYVNSIDQTIQQTVINNPVAGVSSIIAGNNITITSTGTSGTGDVTISAIGDGNANTGNWEFIDNTMYNMAGGEINNGDPTHGATAGLVLPENGNAGAGASLFNTYGNIGIAVANLANSANTSVWTFGVDGNLTLPANTFAVKYANGTAVTIPTVGNIATINLNGSNSNVLYGNGVFAAVAGGANTGNVTFDDINVIGTGNLKLQPDSANANAYLDIFLTAGPDIHIAGNGETVILGTDDFANVAVNVDGNVSIQAGDANGTHTWNFDTTGNLILAGGNSVIQSIANSSSEPLYPNVSTMVFTPDALLSSQALVLDPTGPSHIHLRAPGANIDEPDANIFLGGEDSSFEVGYYNGAAPNLFVHSGGNTWTFDTTGILVFPRDTGPNTTDPILTITGGANPKILSEDASLTGPANLEITALNTIFTGSSGSAIKIYPDDGEVASDGNLQIWANSGGNTEYSWTFDNAGTLTLPQGSQISETANVGTNITANGRTWTFGVNGTLSLPGGLVTPNGANAVSPSTPGTAGAPLTITAGAGGVAATSLNSGAGGDLTITAGDAGSNIGNPSWGEVGGDLTLRSGNSTGPYVGGNVAIYSGAGPTAPGAITLNTGTNQWNFGGTGNLTLPNSATIIAPNVNDLTLRVTGEYNICTIQNAGSGYSGSTLLPTTTTGGTGTGMTVNFGYGISGQLVSVSVSNPGTGYSNGDIIGVVGGSGTFVITKYNTSANQGNNNTAPTDWIFGIDGNITLPNNYSSINYANGSPYGGGGSTGNVTFDDVTVQGDNTQLNLSAGADFTANLAYVRVRSGDVASHIHMDTGNNEAYDLIVGNDDKFVQVSSTGNIIMSSYDGNASYTWTLDTTGNLTLPLGSIVYETNIPDGALSGSAIALKPIGGTTANQQLLIYPTAADGDHIHMTSGNLYATELFLGSDNLYVKLANTGNVVINSNDGNSSNAMWTFDTDGNLTLPGNLVINGLTNVFGSNVALLQSNPDLPLLSVSSGSNGGVSSLWVEDIGNVGTSNIAAVYTNPTSGSGIVRIAVGQNGGNGGPNLWDFGTDGNLTIPGSSGGFIKTVANASIGIAAVDNGTNNPAQLLSMTNAGAATSIVSAYATNATIQTNATGAINTWAFDSAGNLTLPGNTFAVNYANGTQVPVGVTQDITSNGAMSIMTYDGNLKYVNYATVEPSTGNIAGGNLSTTGTVTANTAIITTGNITTINSGLLQNGNSNITITSNGNVSIQSAGSNVELVVTSTGANVTGTLTSTGKIGYASGSTVTQTSNRGNGVNINALAGTIVTVSASMTAGEIGAFSVTNNQVDTNNDIVLVQVVSPNLGNYNVIANPNSGIGGFYVTLQNISGFPISAEAVTIRFMVIKAPNA